MISMAFCESDAIFICGLQWDEIKICMINILVTPQRLATVCTYARGVVATTERGEHVYLRMCDEGL